MTAEITLDGTVLKTGLSYPLGTEIQAKMGFISPNKDWGLANKQFQAGEYHAIGYDMQGVSKAELKKTKEQLESAMTQISLGITNTLTKHDLTGVTLQAGIENYFSINDMEDSISSRQMGILDYRYMSFGTFSTNIQGVYSWGILRQAKFTGIMMDIDRLAHITVDKDNNKERFISYNLAQGPRMSANEHMVPEVLFSEKQVESVSAVKALQVAGQQGQKLFTITSSNLASILPKLKLSAKELDDIQNAVAAGKIVAASQTFINLNGWTGSGYIIIDPQTGSSAYMIGSGMDGSHTSLEGAEEFALTGLSSVYKTESNSYGLNFFGVFKCEFDKVLAPVALLATIAAVNYAAPSIVRMLSIPQLAAEAIATLTTILVSALGMVGVANAGPDAIKDNCECASGIYNRETGSCWICSKESWAPIRGRVLYAKNITESLGACSAAMNSSQLLTRAIAFEELAIAREEENACWLPKDPAHETKVKEHRVTAKYCRELLGPLGGL